MRPILDSTVLFVVLFFWQLPNLLPLIGYACLVAIHVLDPNLNGSSVSLELFYLGQLHNSFANVSEALCREVGARDVFHEGAEVDTRILLGKAVCC